MDKTGVNLNGVDFKVKAALLYRHKFPALSRSLLGVSVTGAVITFPNSKIPKINYDICRCCGTLMTAGNYACRLISKPKHGKYFKKLKEIQSKSPWKLNNYKKRILQNETKTVDLIYRCLACHKITKQLTANKNPHKEPKLNKGLEIKSEGNPHVSTPSKTKTPKKTSLPVTPMQKKSKKKKKNVKSQIKQMLQSHGSNLSCKSRLESFLSGL